MLEEFVLQYYASAHVDPAAGDRPARHRAHAACWRRRWPSAAAAPVEVRSAERGDKRRIVELAERNARLALDQDRLRSERRRTRRIEALDGLQRALGMEQIPMRIECFDISNLGETHTVASMVVFEGGAPKKSDYRRFKIREAAQDDFAAMAEVLSPADVRSSARSASCRRTRRPTTPASPRCRALIVIDGGKGQLSAGPRRARGVRASWARPS